MTFMRGNNRAVGDYDGMDLFVEGEVLSQARQSLDYFDIEYVTLTEKPDFVSMCEAHEDFPNAKMPCGHIISSVAMRQIMLIQVKEEKRHQIRCPALKEVNIHGLCNAVWDTDTCEIIAVLTEKEREDFKSMLISNIQLFVYGFIQCPTCFTLIEKTS